MTPESRILVCGSRGLVGSAIVRHLERKGFTNVLQPPREELDLSDRVAVNAYLQQHRPDFVFMAAAKVGGLLANSTYPADFIRENLAIELNIVDAAWRSGIAKLLMLGSSCIYPRESPQPIREEYLMTGPLEPTNAPYAIAKIAGIMLCQAYVKQHGVRYVSAMPTNLYGPGDNFDLQSSHVIPALLRKFHEAKQECASSVTVWGTGKAFREFLYVDDLADACLFLMERYEDAIPINIGVGKDISIADLARLIGDVVGYRGEVRFDRTKPDGPPRKLLDVSRMQALGWTASTTLREGLARTYEWYVGHSTPSQPTASLAERVPASAGTARQATRRSRLS